MKLLIFSDIHGSLPAARLIARICAARSPEAVLLLGDILYHGPRNPLPEGYDPKGVVETLTPLAPRIIAVQGNCDSEVDAMVLPFPIAPAFIWVLNNGLRIFATHGHIFGPDAMPPLQQGDMLLFGHTHVPLARATPEGILLGNPGSLSLPKEGFPPCYALLEDGIFTVFTDKDEPFLQMPCC